MKDYEEEILNIMYNTKNNIKIQLDRAYINGYEDGRKLLCNYEGNLEVEYNRGLNDAWEVVKKIFRMDGHTKEKLFGHSFLYYIAREYCVSDVLQIIKEYEEQQKQDTEIKVGDEVITAHGGKGIVITNIASEEGMISVWIPTCTHVQMYPIKNLSKTGRTFPQIAEVFAEMRGEE